MMMIETTTYLPYEGGMQNKDDRPVIVFSSKFFLNNALSIFYGKNNPRNRILTKKWSKDSILDGIGVSSDYQDHHSSSTWRVIVEQGLHTCDCHQLKTYLRQWFIGFVWKIRSQEMESLRKTGSKTVFLTILVSLMMIGTTTALPYEGEIQNNYDRPVIVFSSKFILYNALLFSHGKSNPINGILTQNWFKECIFDNIGVSNDNWYH